MLLNIRGKNVSVTDAMIEKVEKKLEFLDKYFTVDDSMRANVVVKVYPEGQKVEITVTTKMGPLRAEVLGNDFYSAVDLAIDKLEDQIRRQKTRLSRRHKDSLAQNFLAEIETLEDNSDDIPVRTKAVTADVMDLSDAILKMEMLGHSFYVYTDDETEEVAIVYQRKEGGYGLLEVEKE